MIEIAAVGIDDGTRARRTNRKKRRPINGSAIAGAGLLVLIGIWELAVHWLRIFLLRHSGTRSRFALLVVRHRGGAIEFAGLVQAAMEHFP